jgi:chromosome segregation ATPase
MSEEITRNLHDNRSFEDRVLARFDAFDARFDSVDARLEKLESRNYDTKPIWERALKAIMETGLEVGELKTKVGVIETKVDGIETTVNGIVTKVGGIETSLGVLEGEVAGMRGDYAALRNELVETQRDFKMKLTRRLDLVLTTLVDNRDGLRDAEERLTKLESKLA